MSSNNKRLTNDIVDKRLINDNKPIKRIGNYINAHIKTEWECEICKNTWMAIPNSILKVNPSGCPHCAGKFKYTNKDIDNKLKNRNLLRIGNYINYDTPIKWKCTKCNHEWTASPNGIIGKHQSNCPVCAQTLGGKRKSAGQQQRVLKILKSKNINLINEYTRIIDKHDFECKKCNYVWQVHLNDIVNNDTGCPSCAGLAKLTNETADNRLLKRSDIIYRIDDIVNARTKCTWRCEHGHEWLAVPDSVLNFGSGCPICNAGFYSRDYIQSNFSVMVTPASLYFVKFTQKITNISFVKIGITKRTVLQRFSGYKKNYNIETLYVTELSLLECINLERDIIYKMKQYQYIPEGKFGGKTECFIDIPEVERKILQLLE